MSLVVVLLGLFAFQCLGHARRATPTVDEFAHVPAGILYYETGDLSFYAKNPPLGRWLCAAPALLLRPVSPPPPEGPPTGWRPWIHGARFQRLNRDCFLDLFFLARLPGIAVGCLLGLVVFLAARRLHGRSAALVALALFSLTPSLVAHSSLATVDVLTTLTIFATSLALVGFVREPSLRHATVSGLLLGLALLSKYTALLVLLSIPVLVLALLVLDSSSRNRRRMAWLAVHLGLLLAVALVVLHAGYLFRQPFPRIDDLSPVSAFLRGLSEAGLGRIPLPVPGDFVAGFDRLKLDLEQGEFPAYLLGSWSADGFRSYFLIALAVVLPIPLLLLAAGGVLSLVLDRGRRNEELLVLVPFVVVGVMLCLFSKVNYGVRYVLPLVPFLLLLAARAIRAFSPEDRQQRLVVAVLLLWNCLSTLLVHPHPLAASNELAGGRYRLDRILLDSNLDWGQDLGELARILREEGEPSVNLAYFGHADPALYGISWKEAPRNGEAPEGLLAVSANFVHGYAYVMPSVDGETLLPVPRDAFAYLRNRRPDAVAGRSIYLYRPRVGVLPGADGSR